MLKRTLTTIVMLLVGFGASLARAETRSLTVTAFVENQVCMGGDFVRVTFSASANSSSQPVGFRWDFTNNGSFDTARSTDPDASAVYPDEAAVTARVGAINREGDRVQDTISFVTLRCE